MKERLRNQGLEISEIKGPPRNTLSLLERNESATAFSILFQMVER